MGILNITQDSFSDGGLYLDPQAAKNKAQQMIQQGADIIDIGAESTRPGAKPVSAKDELSRLIPIIEYLSDLDVLISVDTSKAEVMHAAVTAGAHMINDVCALQNDGALECAATLDVPVCLMHMQGTPQTMQSSPQYDDVVGDIIEFFNRRIENCLTVGIKASNIILDPGFGFGKTAEHNFEMLSRFEEFSTLNYPLLAGLSRKSMIASVIDKPAAQRVAASVALSMLACQKGASIIRVHDVDETSDALMMIKKVKHD